MNSATASGDSGFVHELVLYSSTQEMIEFVVPFVRDAVAAGQPTLLMARPDAASTALDLIGPAPHLTVLPATGQSGRAAADLRAIDALLTGYAPGGPQVRVVRQEPQVPQSAWHEWRRREAVVNIALAHHPAWAVCVHDRRALTADMLDDLYATHPIVGRGDQHLRNPRYQDPVRFIGARMNAPADPAERTHPTTELLDPSPAAARTAVRSLAHRTRLPSEEIDNLVFAVNEAVTNAIRHGRPPVVLRLWAQPTRIIVTVTDTGPGSSDPFVGLLPATDRNDQGLGLWLSHQLVDVTHRCNPDGYTVCLSTAHPPQRSSA